MTQAFRQRIRTALADPGLQQALDRNAERRRSGRLAAFASLPDAEGVRRRASEIRADSVRNLEDNLGRFRQALERSGVQVHEAGDAEEARRIIVGLLQRRGVRRVVKAKSMVTEEIGLNPALEAAGIEVLETDLGEYLVQLRHEPPAHILTPAIHLRRQDVGRLLQERLDLPYTTDVAVMTEAVRQALRTSFLEAEAGISGVNFGVASTGTLCLVTNEGNGRMVTSLPPIHIAVMGIERLVRDPDDLEVMLQVLPRAATGQARTSYVSLLHRPAGAGEADGPRERHVLLVDNGRRRMLESPLREALACIRCGACLNACPVYQEIGGHAYASVIPGPIGSVVSPGLWGGETFGHLARASTLCGACRDACPVDIDLPGLLLRVRGELEPRGPQSGWMRIGLQLYGWLIGMPRMYRFAQRAAGAASRAWPSRRPWIRWLPGPLAAWTSARDFPPFAPRPFRDLWNALDLDPAGLPAPGEESTPVAVEPSPAPSEAGFAEAASLAGAEVIRCTPATLGERVEQILRDEGIDTALTWDLAAEGWGEVAARLQEAGLTLVEPDQASGGEPRQERLQALAAASAGLTGAVAGLADAGTVVLPIGPGRSALASLLPPLHLAILRETEIVPGLGAWLRLPQTAAELQDQGVVLVSGPSRTADIEMTLTIGVHGPKRVVILLVQA